MPAAVTKKQEEWADALLVVEALQGAPVALPDAAGITHMQRRVELLQHELKLLRRQQYALEKPDPALSDLIRRTQDELAQARTRLADYTQRHQARN